MSSSNILTEYLIALGFRVNEKEAKKGTDTMETFGKQAKSLAKGVLAVGVAAKAMVTQYSFQMEKLYYASKRSGSMVSTIQAMEYAGKQIGLAGGQVQQGIEHLARQLRGNPALVGFLERMGVEVRGRDMGVVFRDMAAAISKMPPHIGNLFAEVMGFDGEDMRKMGDYMDRMDQFTEQRRRMAAEAGVDEERASEAGQKYAQTLREIWERMKLLKDAAAMWFLPAFQKMAEGVNWVLREMTLLFRVLPSLRDLRDVFKLMADDWERLAKTVKGPADFLVRMAEGLFGRQAPGVQLSEESKRRLGIKDAPQEKNGLVGAIGAAVGDAWDKILRNRTSRPSSALGDISGLPPLPGKPAGGLDADPKTLFAQLESRYKLPPGLLDRVWAAESGRGRNMRSHAGAEGHFQFMPAAQKDYQLKDPYSLKESAEAAARYYANMLKKYNGDLVLAAAAYNSGPGKVDRLGVKGFNEETQGYVKKVAGVTVEQYNTINVTGVEDPQRAADHINEGMRQNNSELVRNLTPRIE